MRDPKGFVASLKSDPSLLELFKQFSHVLVFLDGKPEVSLHKKRKQFTASCRNIATSSSFVFHLDYQHVCHLSVIYSLSLDEGCEREGWE